MIIEMGERAALHRNPAQKPTRTMAALVVAERGRWEISLVRWRALLTLERERPNLNDQRFQQKVLYAILGVITLEERRWCRGALEVWGAAAQSGYGPMLYDVALTVAASARSPGIMPDRNGVSPEARALWGFYADRRPDVGSRRLALLCPRHKWLGVDVLDRVYYPVRAIAGMEGLLQRGGQTYHQLVSVAGEADALRFLRDARRAFKDCRIHGCCPS